MRISRFAARAVASFIGVSFVSLGLSTQTQAQHLPPRQRRRFSVAASAPATYRTNLGLIETAGQPASVRVTMRYYFPAGLVLSGYAASAKDFTLSPGQFLLVTDAMKAIIGDARSSFGDLHNVQVEIRVTGGDGRVLGFIQSIDNGTGDTILRTD